MLHIYRDPADKGAAPWRVQINGQVLSTPPVHAWQMAEPRKFATHEAAHAAASFELAQRALAASAAAAT